MTACCFCFQFVSWHDSFVQLITFLTTFWDSWTKPDWDIYLMQGVSLCLLSHEKSSLTTSFALSLSCSVQNSLSLYRCALLYITCCQKITSFQYKSTCMLPQKQGWSGVYTCIHKDESSSHTSLVDPLPQCFVTWTHYVTVWVTIAVLKTAKESQDIFSTNAGVVNIIQAEHLSIIGEHR